MRKMNKHQAGKIKFTLIKCITAKIHSIVFPKPESDEVIRNRYKAIN